MKKIIGMILMVTILFSTLAFAEEEFTLHNGTKFGMEPSDVEKIEAENGLTLISGSEEFYSYPVLYGTTKIADYDSTYIQYSFKNNALWELEYQFDGDDSYIGIENSLISKYGETAYSSITGIFFPTIDDIFVPYKGVSTTDFVFKRGDYSQRLIQISDSEYVFIDHYKVISSFYIGTTSTSISHYLKYTAVDAETAQLIRNSIEKANDDL